MSGLPARVRTAVNGDRVVVSGYADGKVFFSTPPQSDRVYIPSHTELMFDERVRHKESAPEEVVIQGIVFIFGRRQDASRAATLIKYVDRKNITHEALRFVDGKHVALKDIDEGQLARVIQIGRKK